MSEPSARKQETGKKLVEAAIKLFARKWYNTVSVAEICREAGLSNGIFYKYYDGKEALFRSILERVVEEIREALLGVQGGNVRERLFSFVSILVDFSARNSEIVSVFREGQYRFFEYEHRLAGIYASSLQRLLGRETGLAEYLFALGGIRFCAIRRTLQGIEIDLEAIDDTLESGIFRGMSFDPELVFGGSVTPPAIDLDTGARERLLKAGKRLFGDKGYFETNIHEITDAAGLSVGAFYSHFAGKEVFYAELIKRAGHDIRSFIRGNTDPRLNRLERELRGIWLFLVFLSIDRHCYSIVREAEFVLPEAVRDYYGAFVEGYRRNPEGNGEPAKRSPIAEETVIEYLLGISHYYGLEVAFDESSANARSTLETIGKYLVEGFSSYL